MDEACRPQFGTDRLKRRFLSAQGPAVIADGLTGRFFGADHRIRDPVVEHCGRDDLLSRISGGQIPHHRFHIHKELQLYAPAHELLVKIEGTGFVVQYFDKNTAVLPAEVQAVDPSDEP